MVASPNSLPDSLTCLLDASAARSFAPTPGDAGQGNVPHEAPFAAREDRLDAVVVRGLALILSGLIWGGILWLILHHFTR